MQRHPGKRDFEEPVEIVDYDPAWPELFAREAAELRRVFGDRVLAIEHIGSTAVPDLAGKPVIDIVVGVSELKASDAEVEAMNGLGYEDMGPGAVVGRLHFRSRQRPGPGYNTNLVVYGERLWRDNLFFRDYLRRHPDEARDYETVKREAAATFPESLGLYSAAKEEFILDMLFNAWRDAGINRR